MRPRLRATAVVLVALAALTASREAAVAWCIERGRASLDGWRLEDAGAALSWAVRLAPRRPEPRVQRAHCRVLRGEVSSALSDLDAVDLDLLEPASRRMALAALFECHLKSKRARIASALFDRAMTLPGVDRGAEAAACIGMGRVLYHLEGRADEALEMLERGLAAAREAGDRGLQADALRHIGVTRWWFRGEVEEAETAWYAPALDLYRREDDRRGEAAVLSNLALLRAARGDVQGFLDLERDASAIREAIGDEGGTAEGLAHAGMMMRDAGSPWRAMEHLRQSLEISRRLGDRLTQGEVEFALAGLSLDLGRAGEALALFQGLYLAEREAPVLARYRLSSIAECQLRLGRPVDAARSLTQALEMGRQLGEADPRFEAWGSTFLAEARAAQGSSAGAHHALGIAEARAAASPAEDPWWIVRHAVVRAELAAHEGAPGHARAWLREAIRADERLLRRSARFQPDRSPELMERIIRLLVPEQGEPDGESLELLFAFVELGRLRSFHFRPRHAGVAPVPSIRELAAGMDAGTLLVSYVPAGRQVLALSVSPRGARVTRLAASPEALHAKVKLLRAQIASDDSVGPVARSLREALLGPIAAAGLMDGVTRLAIATFGPLHDLPFAVLVSPAGRHLVEDVTLLRIPAATCWPRPDAATAATLPVLSLGVRAAGHDGFPDLPLAEAEARSAARLLGGRALVGEEATEARFTQLAPAAARLHVAAHGVTDPDLPVLSSLLLRRSRDADGRLMAREIAAMSLQAELVTLSACDVGRSHAAGGRDAAEADRVGLIQAFLHAGAGAVLASLAPVHDRATLRLMERFHAALREGRDGAEALAIAQRAMKAEPPRHWASFVLVSRELDGGSAPARASIDQDESQRR